MKISYRSERSVTSTFIFCGISLLVLALSTACTKSDPSGGTPGESHEAKEGVNTSADTAKEVAKKFSPRAHALYSWAELKGEKLEKGLANLAELNAWGETLYEIPTELKAKEKAEEPSEGAEDSEESLASIPTPQLKFSKIAGGDNSFCGAMKSGPLKCWGHLDKADVGAYVDVATTGDSACGVTLKGGVNCVPAIAATEKLSDMKRIFAGGGRYCSISKSKSVTCFSAASGELIVSAVPEGFQALYLGVNREIVCAADPNRKLSCTGDVGALGLPADPFEIKDLAVGNSFVCVLDSSSQLKCFGQAPAGLTGEFQSIGGGFDTLCGISKDGKGKCVGEVAHEWEGELNYLAVGSSAVCATQKDGELNCVANSGEGMDVPRDESALRRAENAATEKANREKYAANIAAEAEVKRAIVGRDKLSKARFEAFVELFPEGKLPTSFHHEDKISLGDRLPKIFDSMLGEDANSFLVGEKFKLGSGAVVFSLYDMELKRGVLWSFNAQGARTEFILNSYSSSAEEGGSDEGGLEYYRLAGSHEAKLSTEGLVSTTHRGREEVIHVPTHKDGSKPISRVGCRVDQLKFSDSFDAEGKVQRKSLPSPGDISTSTKDKGCEVWPFDGPRNAR